MRICWFGIYRRDYPRNYILLNGLEELGVQVVECQVDDKARFKYLKLIWKFLTMKERFDIVYAAFPAQSVVPIARFFTLKPVVMDAFYSMYDSVVYDRKVYSRYHPRALWFGFLDWVSFFLATKLITDTSAHADYFATWPLISRQKCRVVPIGSDTRYFFPTEVVRDDGKFLVQYHGSYIPLQGLPLIIEAVKLLQDDLDIHFRFIGSGQDFKKITDLATSYKLERIEFIERVPFTEMNQYLNEADIILGIFGDTSKTKRVIPNKVFEGLAVKKPVITLDTPAAREELTNYDVIYVNAKETELASAIRTLKSDTDKRDKFAEQGYETFMEKLSEAPTASRLVYVLE